MSYATVRELISEVVILLKLDMVGVMRNDPVCSSRERLNLECRWSETIVPLAQNKDESLRPAHEVHTNVHLTPTEPFTEHAEKAALMQVEAPRVIWDIFGSMLKGLGNLSNKLP